jgi:hypothetical protein
VRRGNRAAFAELLRRYERVALSTAWNVLRDYHLPKWHDAVLDMYCRAGIEADRVLTLLTTAAVYMAAPS